MNCFIRLSCKRLSGNHPSPPPAADGTLSGSLLYNISYLKNSNLDGWVLLDTFAFHIRNSVLTAYLQKWTTLIINAKKNHVLEKPKLLMNGLIPQLNEERKHI